MAQTMHHIVFTPSGAGGLRQSLREAHRGDKVVAFFDDLRFGPINPPDPLLRRKWVKDELGWVGWGDVTARSELFWQEACAPDARKVAWLSRKSGLEYAGFLEWLWRLGDAPCEIIDLTEVSVVRRPPRGDGPPLPPAPALSLAILSPDTIHHNNLCDLATPLQTAARKHYLDLWHRLRIENAPLRVVAGDVLRSVPITYFDPLLMSFATDQWRKVAMIVGLALASEINDDVLQTSDIFLASRVNALVESGQLEIRGKSALRMRHSEVRLPMSRG